MLALCLANNTHDEFSALEILLAPNSTSNMLYACCTVAFALWSSCKRLTQPIGTRHVSCTSHTLLRCRTNLLPQGPQLAAHQTLFIYLFWYWLCFQKFKTWSVGWISWSCMLKSNNFCLKGLNAYYLVIFFMKLFLLLLLQVLKSTISKWIHQ